MESEQGHARPQGVVQRLIWQLSGMVLLVITGLVLYATFARYLFRAAPIWGEDLPRILFVWLTYLAAGVAIILGLNIRVTYFVSLLPDGLRRWVEVTMHVLVLVMLAVLAWWSIPIVRLKMNVPITSLGWPAAVFSIPLPLGCLVMGWYQFRLLLRAWQRTGPQPPAAPGGGDAGPGC